MVRRRIFLGAESDGPMARRVVRIELQHVRHCRERFVHRAAHDESHCVGQRSSFPRLIVASHVQEYQLFAGDRVPTRQTRSPNVNHSCTSRARLFDKVVKVTIKPAIVVGAFQVA